MNLNQLDIIVSDVPQVCADLERILDKKPDYVDDSFAQFTIGSHCLMLSQNHLIPLAVQFFVTAKTRVFSKSVGIGAIGTFVGFMMIFVSDKLSLIYPYSQAMVAMRSRNLIDFNLVEIVLFIIVNILLWGIFHTLSNKELHK